MGRKSTGYSSSHDKKLELITKERIQFEEMEDTEKIEILKRKIEATSKKQLNETKLTTFSKNLCIAESLITAYLNPDFKKVLDHFKTSYEIKTHQSFLSSTNSIDQPEENVFELSDSNEDIVQEKEEFPVEEFKTNQRLKIKIILTENLRTMKQKTLRRLAAPFIHKLGVGDTNLGLIHSAISIGPWYLEWNNTELCVPKKFYSGSSLLVIDIKHSYEMVDIEKIIEVLAEVITRWNTLHSYEKLHNNCQTFIDDVLMSLDIETDLKLEGYIKKYIQNLRLTGECPVDYQIPEIIQEKCGFKENKITFETHKQLDEFLNTVLEYYPTFPIEDLGYDLLKGFDRGFWLRHYKSPLSEDFIPAQNEYAKCLCPFDNPKNTKSFYGDDWSEEKSLIQLVEDAIKSPRK
eukprot:gene2305-2773_t